MKLSSLQIEIATADYAELAFSTAADNLIATLTNYKILELRIEFLNNLIPLVKSQPNYDFTRELEQLSTEDVVDAICGEGEGEDFTRWLPLTRSPEGLQAAFDACTSYSDSWLERESEDSDYSACPETDTPPLGQGAAEMQPSWKASCDYAPVLAAMSNVDDSFPMPLPLNSAHCDNRMIRVYYEKKFLLSENVRLSVSDPEGKILVELTQKLTDLGNDKFGIELPFSQFLELNSVATKVCLNVTPVD
jgi:hypothetical protein